VRSHGTLSFCLESAMAPSVTICVTYRRDCRGDVIVVTIYLICE
jgi:hypothetical protein